MKTTVSYQQLSSVASFELLLLVYILRRLYNSHFATLWALWMFQI